MVSETIDLPSSVSYASIPGFSGREAIGYWVGIGGWYSGSALFQAGVEIELNSSTSSPYIFAWYEYIYSNGAFLPPQTLSGPLSLGDQIVVKVTYDPGTGISAASFSVNGGPSFPNPPAEAQFTPSISTVEWVAEIPSNLNYAPNYGSVDYAFSYSTSASDYPGTFYAPLLAQWRSSSDPGYMNTDDEFMLTYTG